MSSFDARKHIRERRLKEAAENLRGKSHFSAPPLVFRPSLPQSVRSSGVDFGDAEKVQNPSEAGDDRYRDETPESPSIEERSRHVSEPKRSAYADGKRRLGTVSEGSPSPGDFLGESPKKVIPGKVQDQRAPKADAGGQLRYAASTSATLKRERNRSAKLQQELNEERKIRNELREALRETQRELANSGRNKQAVAQVFHLLLLQR